jgi:hypothetical protein
LRGIASCIFLFNSTFDIGVENLRLILTLRAPLVILWLNRS